ncbi:MAG: DUF4340 domain-containing protein [Gammaproteobacteria bacterium]
MTGMISKRWLINYLLIILIVLFAFIGIRYGVESGLSKNTISNLKPQDIRSIAFQSADDAFTLAKSTTQWYIESPINWPANNIAVERVLSITRTEIESSLPADEIDLATLGLQSPRAILTVDDTRFAFGAINNIGNRRYVMTGSKIYLIADIHLHFFTQGLKGIIDRRLLPRSLALQNLRLGDLNLSKTTNGGWQNDGEAIAPDQLNNLITNWQTLEASIIKTYRKASMPGQKITAGLEDGSKLEFYLMATSPEIVIARPDLGLQYHFAEGRYYGLLAVARE